MEERVRGHVKRALELAVAAALLVGCGAAGGQAGREDGVVGGATPEERLEMDPMLLRAGPGAEGAIDAGELFERALAAQKARRYEEAARHYEAIVRYFGDSRYYVPALYNLGLSQEELGAHEEASRAYRRIITEKPRQEDAKDAYFRLAAVLEKLDEHPRIVPLMTEVLLRGDVEHFDRVEAHVRRANALLATGEAQEAESGFRTVLELNERAPARQRLESSSHYLAQAHFGLGRAVHQQVNALKLVLPTERMGADLDEKARLLLRSQAHYLRTLSLRHPQWSIAAGFMIGKLYEDFYIDILAAEIPDDLSREAVALYFGELRDKIRPLMERAVEVYEKNLHFTRKMGLDESNSEWTRATSQQLARIKAYLDDPFIQRRAERLVLSKGDWRTLWQADYVARDVVSEALEDAQRGATKRKMRAPVAAPDAP